MTLRLVVLLLLLALPAAAQTQPPATGAPSSSAPGANAHKAAAVPVLHAGAQAKLGHSAAGKPVPVVRPPQHRTEKTPAAPPKPAAAPAKPPPPPPPAAAAKPSEPMLGTSTNQPLPRWAALRADEVNMRSGPGTRYPVQWVYHRRNLPVEIEREFEVWRLVEDEDGVKGWVHQAELVGRRNFAVKGQPATLRDSASDGAAAVAILKPGVIGRIRGCEAGKSWCEVQVSDYRGWLRRDQMWGVFADDAAN